MARRVVLRDIKIGFDKGMIILAKALKMEKGFLPPAINP